MSPLRKLILSILALFSVALFGVGGYILLEDWSFLDALYMTVTTVSTVGFREVRPLSNLGRYFTIVLIVVGVGTMFYTFSSFMSFMVEGEMMKILGRRKVETRIKKLKDHYIVCGFGRIGSLICKELAKKPVPFLVVENKPDLRERLNQEGYLYIIGDATLDETLLEAGILKARGIVSVLPSDADNVFITLTARGLRPDLFIVARAGEEEKSEQKLLRAGADKVVSPYVIGGTRMAHAILKPAVVDFIEIATAGGNVELAMEEIIVGKNSVLEGKTIAVSGVRQSLGIIIVAVKRASGRMEFNPSPELLMEAEDKLIVLGDTNQLRRLEVLAGNSETGALSEQREVKL